MFAVFKYGLLSMVFLSLGISIGCSGASSTVAATAASTVAAAPPPQSTAATVQHYTYETVIAYGCYNGVNQPDLCVLGKFGSLTAPQFARDVLTSLSSQGFDLFSVTESSSPVVFLNANTTCPAFLQYDFTPNPSGCTLSSQIIYTLRK